MPIPAQRAEPFVTRFAPPAVFRMIPLAFIVLVVFGAVYIFSSIGLDRFLSIPAL